MRKSMVLALAASVCMLSASVARADKSSEAFVDPSSLLGNANGFTNANSANLAAKTYSVGAAKQSGCKMKLQFKALSGFVDGELMICLAGADACITSPCNLSNFGNSIVVLPKYSSLSLKSGTKADFADVGCGGVNALATGASIQCYRYSAAYIAGVATTSSGGGGVWLPNPTFVAGGEATDGLVGLCQWFGPPNGGNRLPAPASGLVATDGLMALACTTPDDSSNQWSIRKLADASGFSKSSVHRILQEASLKPHKVDSWCGKSPDPEFEEKQAAILGLYLSPPENALVLSGDEKSQIQALDRTQPLLPLRPTNAKRFTHTYTRHGTTCLLAALLVHRGEIEGRCVDRHTHKEFLDFLKFLYRKYPGKQLHVIIDNYSAHKHSKVMEWASKRRRLTLHFTPTYIAKLATEKLGMSLPQQGQIIVVQSRPSGVYPSDVAPVELKVAKNDLPIGRF